MKIREEFERELPRMTAHFTSYFGGVRCCHRKADYVAEATALAWKWWLRLREVGKDPTVFVAALARFAARAVKSGRGVIGQEKSKDVLSPLAQRLHGFYVGKLPEAATLTENPYAEALADHTRTPPDEQCAFRLDFAAWLLAWDDRRRSMIRDMALGERTMDLADKFKLCPARISQLRAEFMVSWLTFTA